MKKKTSTRKRKGASAKSQAPARPGAYTGFSNHPVQEMSEQKPEIQKLSETPEVTDER